MHLTNLRSRYNWDDKKDINDLKTYWLQMDAEAKDKMTKTDTVQVKEYLAELAEMEHHKLNCERQKKQFNTELEATRTSVSTLCVIVLDYKQIWNWGMGQWNKTTQYTISGRALVCHALYFCQMMW